MKKTLTLLVFIISACILTMYFYNIDPSTPLQALFAACFVAGVLALLVPCIYQIKWRYDNGVDLFATLETDEEKLKQHMLYIMQYHGIEENLKELNDIFRNYPQWDLKNWEVFRAWYKAQINHMLKYPDIYGLTMKDTGEPYSTEKDPLYDPAAPDWEQFDRPHYDDDDDDDDFDDDDFDDYRDDEKKREVNDALAVGIGIGIANGLTHGSLSGGGN